MMNDDKIKYYNNKEKKKRKGYFSFLRSPSASYAHNIKNLYILAHAFF